MKIETLTLFLLSIETSQYVSEPYTFLNPYFTFWVTTGPDTCGRVFIIFPSDCGQH